MSKNFRGRSAKSIEATLLRNANKNIAEDLIQTKVSTCENYRGEIKIKKKAVFDLTHTYDVLDERKMLQPLHEISHELRKFETKSSNYFEDGRYLYKKNHYGEIIFQFASTSFKLFPSNNKCV